MNHGSFAGYLGKDAELRHTPSGHGVLNFSVGVSTGFGENQKTLLVSCALWGDRAEKLAPYLLKGKAVAVAGDVDLRTYETRDGRSGAELMLNVQRVTLMGGNKQDAGERPAQRQQAKPQQQPQSRDMWPAGGTSQRGAVLPQHTDGDFDDGIPF